MDSVKFHRGERRGEPELRVSGTVDLSTSPLLREQLMEVASGGARRIGLDLADVHYIDSSGMSAIIEVWKRLEREGRELAVTGTSPRVDKVFRVMGLHAMLPPR